MRIKSLEDKAPPPPPRHPTGRNREGGGGGGHRIASPLCTFYGRRQAWLGVSPAASTHSTLKGVAPLRCPEYAAYEALETRGT